MVADQQGIRTILSFGTKSVDPKILEQLLVGRDKTADQLFHSIEAIVQSGINQQTLLVGQRGMGKTHLLRILYERSQVFIKKGQLVVAYFSEDEYGIASYFDFLTRVLNAFLRWNQRDAELLSQKMEELQNTSNAAQTRFIQKIISEYIADRPLLILAENFGDILNSIGRQEQGKLRAWLYENHRISIIATSQSISSDFDKEDRPFYGFFQLNYLKPLSFEDSERFLIQMAKLDGREDIVKHLQNRGKAQVRAIHELVKGNHRLLVTFYEFLKSDVLAKLSNHFIKTINDLKPYYEAYVRYLPPQQQKILRYIALARKPQQGAIIARNCFIDQKSLSKQLSELVRKRLIEIIPDEVDKRNKFYDINEPLLRISIEIGEHKEGITALFVDFLALYYDKNELEAKKSRYIDLMDNCHDSLEATDFQYEIQAIERALTLKRSKGKLDSILSQLDLLIDSRQVRGARELLEIQKAGFSDDEYRLLLSYIFIQEREFNKTVKLFSLMTPEFIQQKVMYAIWGYALLQLSRRKERKRLLRESLDKFAMGANVGEGGRFLYLHWGTALRQMANISGDIDMLLDSVEKLNKAIEFESEYGDAYMELAVSQSALAMVQADEKMATTAFDNFQLALSLDSNKLKVMDSWGGSIAFMREAIHKYYPDIGIFKEKLAQQPEDTRIYLWKRYAKLDSLFFFREIFPILKADVIHLAQTLGATIVEWINNILASNLQHLKKDDLTWLRESVAQVEIDVPELKISRLFIDVFEKYVIDKDKNAVYELPKEQRLFFLQNILGEKIVREPE